MGHEPETWLHIAASSTPYLAEVEVLNFSAEENFRMRRGRVCVKEVLLFKHGNRDFPRERTATEFLLSLPSYLTVSPAWD